MHTTAHTTSVALLCAVVIGALALLITGVPADAETEPIQVVLDFDTFLPGVAQTRSSDLEVPVRSEVASAGVVRASGLASAVDWSFRVCARSGPCTPIAEDDVVQAGDYVLEVSGVLPGDTETEVRGAAGSVVGQVQLIEADPGGIEVTRALLALVAAAIVGILLALILPMVGARRRTVGR